MNKTSKTYCFAYLLGLSGQRLWVGDCMICDGPEQLLFVFAVERRLTNEHLVEQDAVSPPIHRLVVRLVVDDLEK